MENRKKYFYLSLAIVSILVITTCVTYAFFNYSRSGTTENSITMGDITFIYDEIDKVGRGINLENTFPMSDNEGISLTGLGKVFNFKIKASTTENIVIPYVITARKKGDNIGNIVKVYLTEVANNGDESVILEPTYYNNLDDFDNNIDKIIKILQVPSNTENYEKNYRFRMWISDEDINGNKVNIGDYNNKSFEIKINVESKGNTVEQNMDEELDGSYSNNLTSAPQSDKGIILAWEYTGSGTTTLDHFPAKADGYIATSTICNGKPGYFDNDTWSLQIPIVSGNTVNCTVTFTNLESKDYKGLAKMILDDNELILDPPTLNNTSTAAGDTNGLYYSVDTNSGSPTYYFRGNVTNNIVEFAGKTWKVVRINEDGTVRLILTDSIDKRFQSNYNNFNYMYFTYKPNSTATSAMTKLNSWYETNIVNAGYGDKVSTGGYFCEQAKVAGDGKNGVSTSNFMTNYASYTPNFRCQEDPNGHGIVVTNIGLITYDELIYAGNYPGISNSSNFLSIKSYFATMSPAGVSSSGYSSIWHMDPYLKAYDSDGSQSVIIPVINLKSNVTATKDLSTGHYVIQ